ncbi:MULTISPECIES: hypothetical protein [Ruminococcus]|uniref:hypothetical protein n=1 Tax=Ruminococcus TaxID=1263 RepID=UPI001D102A99|nr:MULTISPECIES: hypothetical protein [Ruminococcus]MCC2758846.1 hypothetical protein [Ruminococcus callidus]
MAAAVLTCAALRQEHAENPPSFPVPKKSLELAAAEKATQILLCLPALCPHGEPLKS